MPTVHVNFQELLKMTGAEHLGLEEFEKICLQFGLEVEPDEVDDEKVKIEIAANRPDLLSSEGLALALSCFLGTRPPATYRLVPPEPRDEFAVTVMPETADVRPFMFGAILRGINLKNSSFESFIDLQDKLHQNIARKRKFVAIGTHDLSTLRGPFTYEARPPEEIVFIPLNQHEELDGHGVMKLYSTHPQLKQYLPIIRDAHVYPAIFDSQGVLLSMPPIINGDHSKMTEETKDIFIDVTATDRRRGEIVLGTLVALFSMHCAEPFTIEPVRITYHEGHRYLGGKSFINPNIKSTSFRTSTSYFRRTLGIPDLGHEAAAALLQRMMFNATALSDGDGLDVSVPFVRSDVLHECDIAEDVGIAFGFNNIPYKEFAGSVSAHPMSNMTAQLRRLLSSCGFHEAQNFGLCAKSECFSMVHRAAPKEVGVSRSLEEYDPSGTPVILSNPKTTEFEIVRTSLVPGLLKTLQHNKHRTIPIKLFEIGDVVTQDAKADTGSKNRRYMAALYAGKAGSGLEEVHGLMDLMLQRLEISPTYPDSGAPRFPRTYRLAAVDDEMLMKGRGANVMMTTTSSSSSSEIHIGILGTLHPSVLRQWDISLACSIFEICVNSFTQWIDTDDDLV